MAIESIQERTKSALGKWCNVHWVRRAPFNHQYAEGQELTLMSESPALHMNCTQGLFQAILMDAEDIPELSLEEAAEVLTMLASFLNLNDAKPETTQAMGKELMRAGNVIKSAVKDMGLLYLIKEKFEKKFAAKTGYGEWSECDEGHGGPA